MNFTNKFSARGTFVALASLIVVFANVVPLSVLAFNSEYYSEEDFPWFDENYQLEPALFREIQIQLCAIGIWNISSLSDVQFNSGVTPSVNNFKYSGTNGAPRPTGTTILNDYGAGDYYFESYNSQNCPGLTDETFPYSWVAFTVDQNGDISNKIIGNTNFQYDFDYVNNINNLNTRFTSVLFTDGTSNNGNVNFSIDYFLDLLEIDVNNSSRNPSLVSIELAQRPSTNFSATSYSITPFVAGTSTESGTLSSVANGTYDVLVRFSNASVLFGSPRPFSQSYVYTTVVMSGGNLTSMGPLEFYDGRKIETFEDYKYKDCSLTQFDNCFTNAFIYLFTPPLESLNIFSQINDNLSQKFPFAYVYDFSAIFTTIYNTEQSQTADISIPFADAGEITLLSSEMLSEVPFSGLIRDSLAALLWFFLAYTLYRRSLTVFNSNT